MDLVFKALADPSRRELLDRLHLKDGQTLQRLCADLAMTRQAVTKHLLLLEEADLVKITWQGREKLHYLNPEPLHRISARWINKFDSPHPVTSRHQPSQAATIADADGESRWTNLHTIDTVLL